MRLDQEWLSPLSRNLADSLYQMRRRGKLQTIQRGRYVVATEGREGTRPRLDYLETGAEVVLARLRMPYYLSWHSALWHYGLLDQQSRHVYVAVTGRKRDARLGLQSIRFITVAQRKFFGRVERDEFERPVWLATAEKALIDSLDQPRLAAPMPVIANALRVANREGLISVDQLVADAIRFGSPTVNRRLGFFMDLFGIEGSDELTLHLGRGYAVALAPGLKPAKEQRVRVNSRWRVYEDPGVVGAALELK